MVLFIYAKKLYNGTNTQFLEILKEDLLWDTQLLLSVLQVPLVLNDQKCWKNQLFQSIKIRYLASARSAGKVLQFKGQDVTIEETTEDAFEGVDIALFSAGGSTSAKYAPYAVKAGAVVVDNTSYFRQNPDVPLVVPEVNAHVLDAHNGIIHVLTVQLFK